MNVYVPVARVGGFAHQSALYRTKVQAVVNRSVDVDVRGGTFRVAASAVHTSIAVLILRLGDLSTEETLLDPLAKSQLHFGRLLLTDDTVRLLEVRSLQELEKFWQREHANYAQVVIIGHGGPGTVKLAVDGKVDGNALPPFSLLQMYNPKFSCRWHAKPATPSSPRRSQWRPVATRFSPHFTLFMARWPRTSVRRFSPTRCLRVRPSAWPFDIHERAYPGRSASVFGLTVYSRPNGPVRANGIGGVLCLEGERNRLRHISMSRPGQVCPSSDRLAAQGDPGQLLVLTLHVDSTALSSRRFRVPRKGARRRAYRCNGGAFTCARKS